MLASRRLFSAAAAAIAMAVAVTGPASRGSAADYAAPIFGYDLDRSEVAAAAPETPAEPAASELECMAKVVLHEAGNQPHDGQVAVAQAVANRLAAGRFGGSVCDVVNAPGQFFATAAYRPDRDGDGWAGAMAVARDVLRGEAAPVAPGALFFRAAYSPPSSFFRSRQRVAAVGAHIFYR